MKMLRSELNPNIILLLDISLIFLRTDELAEIRSAVECLKIYHLYPKKSEEPKLLIAAFPSSRNGSPW